MKHPRVSVIMSVFNGERYISEAIESVLYQTFSDFELLIMDDGSQDNSNKILKDFAKCDNRIKLYFRGNKGLTKSLNELTKKVRGTYIARMDADDISHPDRFSKQIVYLESNPKCGVVGSGSFNIDESGRIISCYILPDNHDNLLGWLKKGFNVYKHGSIMLRKSVLDSLTGPYRFYYGQDFDLIMRISETARLGMVQEVLFKYRMVGESIQGIVAPIRERQIGIMLDLHFKRKQCKPEGNWQAIEKQLLMSFSCDTESTRSSSNTRNVHTDYANARALFQAGRFKDARKYFSQVKKGPGFKNTRKYFLLTFLPKTIAIRIQRAMSYSGDKWKSYRIPSRLWPHIDKGFELSWKSG